jgi:hypothetical protein
MTVEGNFEMLKYFLEFRRNKPTTYKIIEELLIACSEHGNIEIF